MPLRAVVGHVTMTKAEVVAWFVLAPHSTSWRDDSELEAHLSDGATSLSRLGAVRTFWRVTSRPVSARKWAERTYADAVAHGTPLPGYTQFMEREQRHMMRANLTEKVAFVGVRVAERRRHPWDPRREVQALADRLSEIADHMDGRGLRGHPADPEDMELLLRRSAGLGMPAPQMDEIVAGDWGVHDLPVLEQLAEVTALPLAKTAQVRAMTDEGREVTKHVSVLTLAKVGRLSVPQDGLGGWMQRTDSLGFPVEWYAVVDLIDPITAQAALTHQMDIIRDQHEHFVVEHKIPAPELLKRQHQEAQAAEHELQAGLTGETTRTQSWVRVAVWGNTKEEAARKVGALKKLYGSAMEWWNGGGQYQLVREFMPGNSLTDSAHCQRFVLPSFLAAMPAATARLGDGYGMAFGSTSGISRTAVSLALWRDMEDVARESSGLTIVSGTLAAGKSYLGASFIAKTVIAGVMWSVLDPSGRLGALCNIPELRDFARYYDLSKGKGGELGPYLVVAEPVREHYPDTFAGEGEYQAAVKNAESRRRDLMRDTLSEWLPPSYSHGAESQKVDSILGRVSRAVPARSTTQPAEVLDLIRRVAEGEAETELGPAYRILARDIYEEISGNAYSDRGRLVFGESQQGHQQQGNHLLEVYGLQGVAMPKPEQLVNGVRETDQRISIALFGLAAWKVQSRTFQADPNVRKGLLFDEGHLLMQFPSGPGLLAKAAVDNRKHNTRAMILSQNVTHLDLGNLANLAGMVIVGKTIDDAAGEEGAGGKAVSLLGRSSKNPRYVRALADLSRPPAKKGAPFLKEFVIATKDDSGSNRNIECAAFDMSAHPEWIPYIRTTPGQSAPVTQASPERDGEAA